jgi:molybdopterin-guanine dinucleotide biosynthesis protein A
MNPCQAAPLRGCLLSGGASRRMGRDKALLPHPEGGTWLVRTLRLLLELEIPVTLCSRHERHLQLARELHGEGDSGAIEALAEPPPWEGPLLALHRLMERHPEQRLLLCPVDMPTLTAPVLRTLMHIAAAHPERIHLAHDGQRCQPLLGLYPSSAPIRSQLAGAVERGERRLQGWLATQVIETVPLDPRAIRNVNRPEPEPSNGNAPRGDQSAGR